MAERGSTRNQQYDREYEENNKKSRKGFSGKNNRKHSNIKDQTEVAIGGSSSHYYSEDNMHTLQDPALKSYYSEHNYNMSANNTNMGRQDGNNEKYVANIEGNRIIANEYGGAHNGTTTKIVTTREEIRSDQKSSNQSVQNHISIKTEANTNSNVSNMNAVFKNQDAHNYSSRSALRSSLRNSSIKLKPLYEITDFQRDFGKGHTLGNKNSRVTVEQYISQSNQRSINRKQKGLIPMLKTHKAYDISFSLDSKPLEKSHSKSYNSITKKDIETVEYCYENYERNNSKHNNRRISTNDKVIQTEHHNESSALAISQNVITDGHYNERPLERTYDTNIKMAANQDIHDIDYTDNRTREDIYTTETTDSKERLIVEYPDGHQEKRDFRRETNQDGDVNYLDILNGSVLKVDKASWKSGEEYIMKGNNEHKIRYEWCKDPNTNSWVKYNSETNEILKQGDWRSGSEWIRNSKGKLMEKSYKYTQNENGEWIKVDSIGYSAEFSTSSAITGYSWVQCENQKKKKLVDKRWRKQHYKYVQTDKGKWEKIDQETMKRIGKLTKQGWKEGIDHHMDKNGRVKKVTYVWDIKENGSMNKVNKKTKKPINSTWKEGREIIMSGDNTETTNFAWVELGRGKWLKIDQDTGSPMTSVVSKFLSIYITTVLGRCLMFRVGFRKWNPL